MFRPSRSSSGPPIKQTQELFSFSALWDQAKKQRYHETCKHVGSQNAEKLNNSWIYFLGGPEDDLLGRNMSP